MTAIKKCPHNSQISCSDCRLGAICLPLSLEDEDVIQLDKIVERGKPYQQNEYIYEEGDEFKSVYAVRSGCVKAYRLTADGQEQVTGFFYPGEIIGLDGISKNRYAVSAKALEVSALCEIPFQNLEKLGSEIPSLQRCFFKLMSQEITYDQQLITLLSKHTSEERVAALLLSISARNVRRKLSPTRFRFPMSRTDIGNFLGLTVETVSRTLSRFAKKGLIEVNGKELAILDIEAVKDVCGVRDF